MRRGGRWGILLGVCSVVALLWLGRSFWLRPRPYHVLLITLDTTRSDRLGCYGYAPGHTPNLDELAQRGVLFERAYTPAPLTLPSHASLLSGLYPPEHGLMTNGRGQLPAGVPTVAEHLHRAGYSTAAFVGSFVLHSKFGLNRGFDLYDDDLTNTDPMENSLHRQRDGKVVVDRVLNWLDRRHEKPFFCWVHLYDAHHPYQHHETEFGARFRDQPYDGEVAYVDRQLGRLIAFLDERGLRQNTLIIVAGDHGESLGEHDETEHSLTLYDSVLRVPWIWTGAGVPAQTRRIPQAVSLLDFTPTLLEALGQRPAVKLSGRSLLPALLGREIEDDAGCYSATDDPLLELGCAPLRSLATSRWKYIRTPEAELYDLAADPRELTNLASSAPDQIAEMDSQLAILEARMTARKGDDVQLSPSERRALESLGYLGGTPSQLAGPASESLPDIKGILPLFNAVEKIRTQTAQGDTVEAEAAARTLLSHSPDFVEGQLALAEVLLELSKWDECRRVLDQILARQPDYAKAHVQLGLLESAEGRLEEALAQFQTAVQLKLSAGTLYNLAVTLSQLGRMSEAKDYFAETLDVDPTYAKAYLGLSVIFFQEQHWDEAAEQAQLALDFDHDSLEAHTNLAVALIRLQRTDDALSHLTQAVNLAPKNSETHVNLGTFLLSLGRIDDAIVELSEGVRLDPANSQAADRLQQARSLQSRRP